MYRILLATHRVLHRWNNIPSNQRTRWQRLMFGPLSAWFKSTLSKRYGAYIHPAATIGRDVVWIHQLHGIFIGGAASIGDRCMIHHRATIGSTPASKKRPEAGPQIGNDVMLGADVTLIGDCRVGDGARIGAGVTLTHATIAPGEVIINKSAYSLTRDEFVYPQGPTPKLPQQTTRAAVWLLSGGYKRVGWTLPEVVSKPRNGALPNDRNNPG